MSQTTDSRPDLIQADVDPKVPETSGMRWVGASFNPSANPYVDEFKTQVALAVDTLERWVVYQPAIMTPDMQLLYEQAKSNLLIGQMLAVKLFTWNK